MRVKGVSFSCSRRAIVLPDRERWHAPDDLLSDHPTEEGAAMPMIDQTKVEPLVMTLVETLREAGCTITGHDLHRFKVTSSDGKTCLLPGRFNGNSDLNEVRRQLKTIGIEVDKSGAITGWKPPLPPDVTVGVKGAQPDGPEVFLELLGFVPSDGTGYLMQQAFASLRHDLDAHIKAEAEKHAPGKEWQVIAEEAEAKLVAARKERDTAVADVVRQRDEARKRAEAAEREIAEVRRSLSGLSQLFAQPGPAK